MSKLYYRKNQFLTSLFIIIYLISVNYLYSVDNVEIDKKINNHLLYINAKYEYLFVVFLIVRKNYILQNISYFCPYSTNELLILLIEFHIKILILFSNQCS